jgi:DNA mismatch repair protein MutL
MKFSGWLAKPSFSRSQNDLCYSYVNGRMMRDKLINHAIRQAYADLLPKDTYPAFVLFLELDYREVDVNVHPAKHEVRFHQSRYVHDFIYSVCHKALLADNAYEEQFLVDDALNPKLQNEFSQHDKKVNAVNDNVGVFGGQQTNQESGSSRQQGYGRADYIKPL